MRTKKPKPDICLVPPFFIASTFNDVWNPQNNSLLSKKHKLHLKNCGQKMFGHYRYCENMNFRILQEKSVEEWECNNKVLSLFVDIKIILSRAKYTQK